MQKKRVAVQKYGVQVGAHPGLPDLQGFGRRKMAISPAEAEADVMYQIGALKAFCEAAGVRCTTSNPMVRCTIWPPRTLRWPRPSAVRCRPRPQCGAAGALRQ